MIRKKAFADLAKVVLLPAQPPLRAVLFIVNNHGYVLFGKELFASERLGIIALADEVSVIVSVYDVPISRTKKPFEFRSLTRAVCSETSARLVMS